MKKLQKVLAAVLVLALLLGCAPLGGGGVAVAATSTNPAKVTVDQAQQRLNKLIELFEDKYFTVDQKYCVIGSHSSNHANCLMSNVVATTWCKNLVGMGTLDPSLFPAQYDYDKEKMSVDGYQCYGFANFAHWYIFAQKNTDNLVSTLVGSGAMTQATLKNARPGDVVRTNWLGGHSMVFISCDSSGFQVLDCNYKDNATGNEACKVKVHKVSYNSSYQITITGVENYDRTVIVDNVVPTVSNVKVTDVDPTGFTVSCTATDNVGVSRVQFVAWTQANAQDDLEANWATNAACKGTKSGNTWTFRVKTSRHNNERGVYNVSIYAYDAAGNRSKVVSAPLTTVRAQYTVTYDANGGNGAPAAQIKEEGKTLTLSTAIPTRPGYTFVGWQGSAKAANGQWTATKPTQGSATTGYLYFTYGGEYNGDPTYCFGKRRAGMFEDSAITKESQVRYFSFVSASDQGAEYKPSSIKANAVTFTGATSTAQLKSTNFFRTGPVYQQSNAVPITAQPGGSYVVDGDITLKAVWEEAKPTTYTVTYNANGGTAAPGPQTKTQGQALTLSSATPTRSGYTFQGWATDRTATSAAYQPGSSYTAEGNVTLYAVWKAIPASYTVTYNANGGVGAPAAQTKTQGQALTLNSATPTRGGYTFQGWATSSTATSAAYQPGGSYTADANVTLYAVWKQNAVVIPSGSGKLSISQVTGAPGDEVEAVISLDVNPGIAGLSMQLDYDKTVLELVGFETAPAFKALLALAECTPESGRAAVAAKQDTSYTGDAFLVRFRINSNTKGTSTAVDLVNLKAGTLDETPISFVVVPGSVTVADRKPGDATGDGSVDIFDLLRMLKYINGQPVQMEIKNADVTGDGEVDIFDLLRLLKYINGQNVELK